MKTRIEKVRPVAICLCRDNDRILVSEFREQGRLYYRPLGGTIEFGEHGEETIQREFQEEIATDLTEVRYLGMLENIYTHKGLRGHEIVLVYDGRLTDNSLYEKEVIRGNELGKPFKAIWKRLDEFDPEKAPVYPEGLLALLNSSGQHLSFPASALA
jgi:8-oxo-dGTP pyrophosphatase MutT (NUDIX family)